MTPPPLYRQGVPAPVPPAVVPRLRWWKRTGLGFLITSVVAHILFGLGATYLVVQSIQAKSKQTFAGAPSRPAASTNVVEHKVQMQKKLQTMTAPAQMKRVTTAAPNTRVALPSMPALPTLSSTLTPAMMTGMGGPGLGLSMSSGGGQSGGTGTGSGINLFGVFDAKHGVGLQGTFYDLKQTNARLPTKMTPELYGKIVTDFANGGFNESLLSRFFKPPSPLYTTQIWVPEISADRGPAAFHLQGIVKPSMWCVLYKGEVVAPQSFTFHFVGAGDDVMLVRFNGRLVLDRCWYIRTGWKALANYSYNFSKIPDGFAKGDAIQVEAGHRYPIEVLIGEQPGGEGFATLLQEIDGTPYDKDPKGNPILPVFRMADIKPLASTAQAPYPPHRDDGPVWGVEPPAPNNQ